MPACLRLSKIDLLTIIAYGTEMLPQQCLSHRDKPLQWQMMCMEHARLGFRLRDATRETAMEWAKKVCDVQTWNHVPSIDD